MTSLAQASESISEKKIPETEILNSAILTSVSATESHLISSSATENPVKTFGGREFQISCDFNTLKILYKNEKDKTQQQDLIINSLRNKINQLLDEKEHLIGCYESIITKLHDIKNIDLKFEELHQDKLRKAAELKNLSETLFRIKMSQVPDTEQDNRRSIDPRTDHRGSSLSQNRPFDQNSSQRKQFSSSNLTNPVQYHTSSNYSNQLEPKVVVRNDRNSKSANVSGITSGYRVYGHANEYS